MNARLWREMAAYVLKNALNDITHDAAYVRRSRLGIAYRILRPDGIPDESWRDHAETFALLCDQAERVE